ncbi:PepSY domain-containing protein [Govanella unica]|uniref:PepSY domain-containing protein n=1 Tax=Govanella unica TaxID=2975056 RepID=A0A9X3Z8D5_9PROT|nr:PepSY domain-containing protein [Govania unica]MDA5195107.1 hypothetical protein [Govania unica]
MMSYRVVKGTRWTIAAGVVALLAIADAAGRPVHAFDPDRPVRQAQSRKMDQDPPVRGIPAESGQRHGVRPPYPSQSSPNHSHSGSKNVEPRSDGSEVISGRERKPSALYPNDDRDRRALQQMMGHDRARAAVQTGTIRSLTEIRGQVRRQFDGRIVGVELYENRMGGGPDWVYDLRVLNPHGNVVAVEMDARTGRVLAVRGMR